LIDVNVAILMRNLMVNRKHQHNVGLCGPPHLSQKLPMTLLSQKVEQTLLADIENTGLPLDQVSLVDLCGAKEGIYGAPGKNRWPVQ
jgi:hypothetical protein